MRSAVKIMVIMYTLWVKKNDFYFLYIPLHSRICEAIYCTFSFIYTNHFHDNVVGMHISKTLKSEFYYVRLFLFPVSTIAYTNYPQTSVVDDEDTKEGNLVKN